MSPSDVLLLTRADVAARLGVSTKQIGNMLARGQIPGPQKVSGIGGTRWSAHVIEEWLRNPAPTPQPAQSYTVVPSFQPQTQRVKWPDNPIDIRYHLAATGIRVRPNGRSRKRLESRGVEFEFDGWVNLSEAAGLELQFFAGAATARDRNAIVARADLERWLSKETPAESPWLLPLVQMDWHALAVGIESLLSTPATRADIVALLVQVGMSERTNPFVVTWAALRAARDP